MLQNTIKSYSKIGKYHIYPKYSDTATFSVIGSCVQVIGYTAVFLKEITSQTD